MVSVNALIQQERISDSNSTLHNVDSRIKLIVLILVIVFTVTSTNYSVFLVLELYLLSLFIIAKVPIKEALLKVLVILPFGLFIAIFQPFIQPGQVLYTLPLGINITLEGIAFAQLLLSVKRINLDTAIVESTGI